MLGLRYAPSNLQDHQKSNKVIYHYFQGHQLLLPSQGPQHIILFFLVTNYISLAFHSSLITYGERKIWFVIIAYIMGRICALSAPTSVPPLAVITMLARPSFLLDMHHVSQLRRTDAISRAIWEYVKIPIMLDLGRVLIVVLVILLINNVNPS